MSFCHSKGGPSTNLVSPIVHAPFWSDVRILKLTKNMRLLSQSQQMTPVDRFKAESFAEWLLTVGEGKDNTIPMTELPLGMLQIPPLLMSL